MSLRPSCYGIDMREKGTHYCSYVFIVFVLSWIEFTQYIKGISDILD